MFSRSRSRGDWETETGPADDGAVTGITIKFPLVNHLVTKTDGEMASGHYTHIFTPTTINQLMFGYALDYGPSELVPAKFAGQFTAQPLTASTRGN